MCGFKVRRWGLGRRGQAEGAWFACLSTIREAVSNKGALGCRWAWPDRGGGVRHGGVANRRGGVSRRCPRPQVPREAPREPPGRAAERAARELQRRSQGYRLVDSDDEGAGPAPSSAPSHGSTPGMADASHRRRRHLRRRRSESPEASSPSPPTPP